MNLPRLAEKARHSWWHRSLLTLGLNFMVPFNLPHRLKVLAINKEELLVKLPYRRSNLNHLKGLHACALATLCEVSSGFLLISRLDPKQYRIILKSLAMDYHWQGRSDATAHFKISDQWLEEQILAPLRLGDSCDVMCEVKIHDSDEKLLATGRAHWQIKHWRSTRLKS